MECIMFIVKDLDLSKTGLKDRPAVGHIGFQDEAKNIWYRNVRIKELAPCPVQNGQELFKADLSNAIYPSLFPDSL